MKVAIIGVTGFLGRHLLSSLIDTTDYSIVAISRHPDSIVVPQKYRSRVTMIAADILDEEQMTEAMQGVSVAYFFVHMMGQHYHDFVAQEATASHRFAAAAIAAHVQRVIYMGGLGNDHERLSDHLASRHQTGTILRENLPLVIEFRAAMIVGDGSVAYDIIRNLVHKLPVMTLPRWSISLTQPIGLSDALNYLTSAATVKVTHHEIIEIGGPEVMSYKQLYKHYAAWVGRQPVVIYIPFIPEWLGGWWLDRFTPKMHPHIGTIMVRSMSNSMVVTHNRAEILFPDIKPHLISQAFARND